jgi:tetratricopeptide (TPR) repeat protein/tRNA A-37 threonylcarbamoyl transferase component Bud32
MIGRTLSHYRILEKLGEGGMGVVYLAEDTLLGRRVAIKMLHARRQVEAGHFRARFLREARAVSALSHPHIATIYDYGETEDGEPYIVMEFIKGETLGELMLTEKLTIARAIEIIKQVGEALGEAHRHGIIHRDIKPTNVAINERGRVKVLDFGLAKQMALIDSETTDPENQTLLVTHTREGVIVGTPMYLSPEQAMGNEVDARSDLFSLGGLLYECIAGKPPFDGKSAADICAKVMRDDPDPPSTINPDIPAELDRITLKSLAKKPEGRYQNAEEMIAELENLQVNLLSDAKHTVTRIIPTVAGTKPTGAMATLSDIFRRPRLPLGYVLAAVLGIALLAFGLWFLLRARPHQPNAEAQRLYETGTNALRAGSYFQASKALGLAVHSDDQFALAHARLAEACMELDYSDRAKDELLRVGELSPNRSLFTPVDALYLDAITATVRRDFSRAVSAYGEIVRLEPNQSYAYVDLGRAYDKNNQLDKAIENFLLAANKDPQNATAFLQLGVLYGRKQKFPEANAAFDKADTIYQALGNVEGRAEVALQRGVLLNDVAGKIPDARAQLEQARDIAKVVNNTYQQIRILFQLSSVAIKEGQADQARQYADEAVQLAQTNQMESMIARGNAEIGNVYLGRGNYTEAEKYFQQALEAAQRYGGRRNEARARLSLASLYIQRGESDRGLEFDDQALAFFQPGGYRTETSQGLLLRGRAYKQKGDYKSAQQSFQDQLKLAEQAGDQAQIAYSHGSIGTLLYAQEQYAEARPHFEEANKGYQALGNQLYQGYWLTNLGAVLWKLGNAAEARQALNQATEIAKQKAASFTGLQAAIGLVEADIAMNNRDFTEAGAHAKQALELAGAEDPSVAVEAKSVIGLSQALSGHAAAGLPFCEEANKTAATLGDPLLLAKSQIALAEVVLANGDAKRALELVKSAQPFLANNGMSDSNWHASLIAAMASEKLLDHEQADSYLNNARNAFASLDQKWGAETFKAYQVRPDIQFYRKQLDRGLVGAR